ncbi:MAG: hypothetical protein IJ165_05570 [Proteobacteria bacterium]|nr:hypothetical protein [Pseudomonadota bacterium]
MTDRNKEHDLFDFSSALDGMSNASDLSNSLSSGSLSSFDSDSTGTPFGGSDTFGSRSSFGSSDTFGSGSSFGSSDAFGSGSSFGGSDAFGSGSSFGSSDAFGSGSSFGGSDAFGSGSSFGSSDAFGSTIPTESTNTLNSPPIASPANAPSQANTPSPKSVFEHARESADTSASTLQDTAHADDFIISPTVQPVYSETQFSASDFRPGEAAPVTAPQKASATPASMSERWKNASLVNQYLQKSSRSATDHHTNTNGADTIDVAAIEQRLRAAEAANQNSSNSPQSSDSKKSGCGCLLIVLFIFVAPFAIAIIITIFAVIGELLTSSSSDTTSSPSFEFSNTQDDNDNTLHIDTSSTTSDDMPQPVFDFMKNADTETLYECIHNSPHNKYQKVRASVEINFYISDKYRAKDISLTSNDFTLDTSEIEECTVEFFNKLPDFPLSSNRYQLYTWKFELYMN